MSEAAKLALGMEDVIPIGGCRSDDELSLPTKNTASAAWCASAMPAKA